jgi:hypothetical protein
MRLGATKAQEVGRNRRMIKRQSVDLYSTDRSCSSACFPRGVNGRTARALNFETKRNYRLIRWVTVELVGIITC